MPRSIFSYPTALKTVQRLMTALIAAVVCISGAVLTPRSASATTLHSHTATLPLQGLNHGFGFGANSGIKTDYNDTAWYATYDNASTLSRIAFADVEGAAWTPSSSVTKISVSTSGLTVLGLVASNTYVWIWGYTSPTTKVLWRYDAATLTNKVSTSLTVNYSGSAFFDGTYLNFFRWDSGAGVNYIDRFNPTTTTWATPVNIGYNWLIESGSKTTGPNIYVTGYDLTHGTISKLNTSDFSTVWTTTLPDIGASHCGMPSSIWVDPTRIMVPCGSVAEVLSTSDRSLIGYVDQDGLSATYRSTNTFNGLSSIAFYRGHYVFRWWWGSDTIFTIKDPADWSTVQRIDSTHQNPGVGACYGTPAFATSTTLYLSGIGSSCFGEITDATVPGPASQYYTNSALSGINGTLYVSFKYAADQGGAAATSYVATLTPGGTTCTTTDVGSYTGYASCNFNNLTGGVTYSVSVVTINPVGSSVPYDMGSFYMTTPPLAPQNASATISGSNATATWATPTSDGGLSITKYTVKDPMTNTTLCTVDLSTVPTPTSPFSCTFTKPSSWTTSYMMYISAWNSNGPGANATVVGSIAPPPSPPMLQVTMGANGAAYAQIGTYGLVTSGHVDFDTGTSCDFSQSQMTMCTLNGLTEGQVVTTTWYGAGSGGTSTTTVGTFVYASPGAYASAPAPVTVTNANTSPVVTWTGVTGATLPVGNQMVIVWDANGRSRTTRCQPLTSTSCTLTGGTVGTKYSFTLMATTTATTHITSGTGMLQVTISAQIGPDPGTPQNVQVTQGDATTATVTWTAPVSPATPIPGITSYLVYVFNRTTGALVGAGTTNDASTFTLDLTNLPTGAALDFKVYAQSMAGNSATPGIASLEAPTPPDAPTNVTASAGNGKATVSWTAPSGSVTTYTVTAYDGSGNTAGTCTATAPSTTCVVTGLTNGSSYTFKVVATNGNGDSSASDPSTSVTPHTVAPGAPTGVTATAGNGSANVSWTAPVDNGGATISSYTVTAYDGSGNAVGTCSSSTLSCQVTGLTNGASYTFKATATNAAGTGVASAPSATLTPYTRPGAPTGVTLTPANGSVTVNWTAPVANGGSAITSYTVTLSPGGATCTVNAPATSCAVSGLTNGIAVTATVTAVTALANSLPSSASASASPQATAPGSPTNISAIPSDGGATISWTAPTDDGGSPVDGYIITASPGGATCTAVAPSTTCTITGLTNGTSYSFSAVASNDIGLSNSSTSSNSVTPAAVSSGADNFQATPGDRSATVKWTAPTSGPAITRYVISSPGLPSCTVDVVLHPGASLQCVFNGLTNGQAYTFTIRAYAANGTSSTDSIWAIPSKNVVSPSSPRNVKFSGSTAGVGTVSWQVSGSNGGSRVLKYTAIVIGPRYFKTCTVNVTANPAAPLRCTFTGLKARRFYMYRVTAVSTAGTTYSARAKRAIAMNVRITTFARGKTTLWSGMIAQSVVTAGFAKQFKYAKIVVTGYTNPGGSSLTRTRFTQARALSVANFLTRRLRSLGITNVQVVAAGTGASLYNGSHLTTKQRRLNRSVIATLSY